MQISAGNQKNIYGRPIDWPTGRQNRYMTSGIKLFIKDRQHYTGPFKFL